MTSRRHEWIDDPDGFRTLVCKRCNVAIDAEPAGRPCPLRPGFTLGLSAQCVECDRELVPELDAYWGKNPLGAMRCARCRPREDR